MHYALHNGHHFLQTGFNVTSSMEMREQLFEAYKSEGISDLLKPLSGLPLEDVVSKLGLTLHKQEQPFMKAKNFRVIAAVTTYCYLDVCADTAEDARTIAKETDGVDYYTMEEKDRPGSFDIIEINPIS